MKNPHIKLFIGTFVLTTMIGTTCQATAHHRDTIPGEAIAVIARPSGHSIILRWAPLTYNVWQSGNHQGYRIERYVVARNGKVLAQPEKEILVPLLKPRPEIDWETLVQNNPYAAIAAQALYGDRFEIDLRQSDMITIVNKVKENQQRYSFALFSADMSAEVALGLGLWFTDTGVNKGEKYLYRVIINSQASERGSVYVSSDDPYFLPAPEGLKAEFKANRVTLKWQKTLGRHYTAYVLERSVDGKIFTSVSRSPMITVAPSEVSDSRFEYATDSIDDISNIYHYRIRGITPFGEQGPPSEVVTGKSIPSVDEVPYIVSAENIDNASILLTWDFPVSQNNSITGFIVERSSGSKNSFAPANENLLPSSSRRFRDTHPFLVNYYRIKMLGVDGNTYFSPVYFTQLVDSIPPSRPTQLKANVDHHGKVILSWHPNQELDIYGYRVYRSYHESEEPAQRTDAPVKNTTFEDSVDLFTLNESVYYRIMAIDANQNHSSLSELLKVNLPDKVKPQPPVFLPISTSDKGILLTWTPGGSSDIVQYRLYRKMENESEWLEIKNLRATPDSLYSHLDEDFSVGTTNYYTAVAIDEAGLESDPALPVAGVSPTIRLLPAIKWKKPVINREESNVTLSWTYNAKNILSFRIYRSVNNSPPVLFISLPGDKLEYTDTMIPEKSYGYRIIAYFENGQKSLMSEELKFQY